MAKELRWEGRLLQRSLEEKRQPSSVYICIYSSLVPDFHVGNGATPLQTSMLPSSKAPARLRKTWPSVVTKTTSTPATQSQVLPSKKPGICFQSIHVCTEELCKGLCGEASLRVWSERFSL